MCKHALTSGGGGGGGGGLGAGHGVSCYILANDSS